MNHSASNKSSNTSRAPSHVAAYPCDECGFVLNTEVELMQHINRHHSEEPIANHSHSRGNSASGKSASTKGDSKKSGARPLNGATGNNRVVPRKEKEKEEQDEGEEVSTSGNGKKGPEVPHLIIGSSGFYAPSLLRTITHIGRNLFKGEPAGFHATVDVCGFSIDNEIALSNTRGRNPKGKTNRTSASLSSNEQEYDVGEPSSLGAAGTILEHAIDPSASSSSSSSSGRGFFGKIMNFLDNHKTKAAARSSSSSSSSSGKKGHKSKGSSSNVQHAAGSVEMNPELQQALDNDASDISNASSIAVPPSSSHRRKA